MSAPIQEYAHAVSQVSQAELNALRDQYGWPEGFRWFTGWPGFATIKTKGDRFEIVQEHAAEVFRQEGQAPPVAIREDANPPQRASGRPAIILPVWDSRQHPGAIHPRIWHEHLIDLVAWQPKHPQRWWTLNGAGTVLGAVQLEMCFMGQEWNTRGDGILGIYRNPLTWARALGQGIVVLDWAEIGDLLHDMAGFVVDDPSLGTKVRELKTPKVWVG